MAPKVDKRSEAEHESQQTNDAGGVAIPSFKPFGLLSLIGMGYTIRNTAITCTGSLATFLGGGGVIFVWGLIIAFLMALCVATSLVELSSAMPHAGVQYFWTSRLAPSRFKRALSYLVGFLSWSGAVLTAASGTLAILQFVFGMVVLIKPSFIIRPRIVFVGYQITNFTIFFLNLFKCLLPKINIANLWISIITTVVIFITLLATTMSKSSAKSGFGEIDNVIGWPDGIAFISALVGPNWGFACLDAVTHMAEEAPTPERTLPKVLLSTVGIGIAIGLPFMIGVMFCVIDFDSITQTPTGVPSLQLFFESTGSKAVACLLWTMVLIVFVGAVYSIHTWSLGWPGPSPVIMDGLAAATCLELRPPPCLFI